MDRILRVLSWTMAAAAFGLAAPVGQAAPTDEDGRGVRASRLPLGNAFPRDLAVLPRSPPAAERAFGNGAGRKRPRR